MVWSSKVLKGCVLKVWSLACGSKGNCRHLQEEGPSAKMLSCLGHALDWDPGTQVAPLFASQQPGSKQVSSATCSCHIATSPKTRCHVTMDRDSWNCEDIKPFFLLSQWSGRFIRDGKGSEPAKHGHVSRGHVYVLALPIDPRDRETLVGLSCQPCWGSLLQGHCYTLWCCSRLPYMGKAE